MNQKSKFQPGDRVRLRSKYPFLSISESDIGTVIIIDPPEYTRGRTSEDRLIGVEWDEYSTGHSLCGRCRDGHGWNVRESVLEFAEEAIVIDDIDSFL